MNIRRNVYLTMQTLAQAKAILRKRFPASEVLPGETVAVPDAVGRVLAESIAARISSPNYQAAAMDGIAVKAEATFGAAETSPKQLILGKEAFWVNTGHVMPPATDAVIMIEHTNALDDDRIQIEAPAFPWQNVRKIGEDIVATELLFPQNHRITPYCTGALLSGGISAVPVRRKPQVLIIPTGTELVDWRDLDPRELKPGQVIETNSVVLGKLVESCGGAYTRHTRLQDDLECIKQAVGEALTGPFDIILIIGGSSAGSEDYAKHVITAMGEVLFHGVTMMPGKPVIAGLIEGKPVFGVPGYPVSAILAFEQFIQPLIYRLLGQPEPQRATVTVAPTRKIASKLGVEEFLRVKLGLVGEKIVATSLPRGAGAITSLTEADGIVRVPNNLEGLKAHEPVAAELLRPLESIRNTVVVVGSHDNTLDVLADLVKKHDSTLTLSSSHVGSMGGLMAVKKGVCHLAGSHLLDTADGSYNISYIKRFLPEAGIRLVHLVSREQGLIVAPGNPKRIKGIADLNRGDIRFLNRQSGSGTRILLDYQLQQFGLDPRAVTGYESEEFTHMAVAVAVLSGGVDVGLGIFAAAGALNLDFIPVVTEQYDLVIPERYFESENIQRLLKIINTAEFKNRVQALGGYHTDRTGEIIL